MPVCEWDIACFDEQLDDKEVWQSLKKFQPRNTQKARNQLLVIHKT